MHHTDTGGGGDRGGSGDGRKSWRRQHSRVAMTVATVAVTVVTEMAAVTAEQR